MSSRNRFNLFLVSCVILSLFISSTSCRETIPTSTQEKGLALLDDITIKDGFRYKDYTWFMSESDFFAKSKMDEETSILDEEGTTRRISDKKTQIYNIPSISAFPIFTFSADRLVKVELIAIFTDVNKFSTCAKDLKAVLDGYQEPRIGNTSFLDEIPPNDNQLFGAETWWDGSDNSRMVVNTGGYQKSAIENEYGILIEIQPSGKQR